MAHCSTIPSAIRTPHPFAAEGLYVDSSAHSVVRQGHEVFLTQQEFLLLQALLEHRGAALSRDDLLRLAWGYSYCGATRTVDVHIQRLRKKLGWQAAIQTVYKVGYRLDLPA